MRKLIIVLGVALASIQIAGAQGTPVPTLINYQASMTDASGVFLEDGTAYEVEFRIWSTATGGTLVWSRAYTVSIFGGRLNVILGATGGTATTDVPEQTDISQAFNGKDRFLGITVVKDKLGDAIAGAAEIVPRQQIISAPYAIQASNGVPPGTIVPFAGNTVPAGWLLCDGTEQTIATYPALAAVLGTTWGVAASGKFKLPDMRGMTAIGAGAGAGVGGLSNRTLGSYPGEEQHTLTVAEMPAHTHTFTDNYHDDGDYDVIEDAGGAGNDLAPPGVDAHAGQTTSSAGSGSAHNNMQPSAVVKYIIKL